MSPHQATIRFTIHGAERIAQRVEEAIRIEVQRLRDLGPGTTAAEVDVLDERQAQREKWGPDHDLDAHNGEELLGAALALAESAFDHGQRAYREDWGLVQRHPANRDRLVMAAALIIAEIERRDRRPETYGLFEGAPTLRSLEKAKADPAKHIHARWKHDPGLTPPPLEQPLVPEGMVLLEGTEDRTKAPPPVKNPRSEAKVAVALRLVSTETLREHGREAALAEALLDADNRAWSIRQRLDVGTTVRQLQQLTIAALDGERAEMRQALGLRDEAEIGDLPKRAKEQRDALALERRERAQLSQERRKVEQVLDALVPQGRMHEMVRSALSKAAQEAHDRGLAEGRAGG